ncbi:Uncharacterized protein APZ42_004641 [Daphnia magna]|uniref:Uncharacterized protein n=1 Tax=Daphnia magna TaxID=35525 RepID=A0A164GXE6_9CRUS|nr:Uncharacterized protein APZ42_004641 [Daphnia magna]
MHTADTDASGSAAAQQTARPYLNALLNITVSASAVPRLAVATAQNIPAPEPEVKQTTDVVLADCRGEAELRQAAEEPACCVAIPGRPPL